jgi:hypothetical protein
MVLRKIDARTRQSEATAAVRLMNPAESQRLDCEPSVATPLDGETGQATLSAICYLVRALGENDAVYLHFVSR